MATDLPMLSMQQARFGGHLDQNISNRQIFNSAVHVRYQEKSGRLLPSVKPESHTKRNSEGQILQVKFAPEVRLSTTNIQARPEVEEDVSNNAVVQSVLKVDNQHYEQWARVPGRRAPNSSLLRGIQALKARMKRESMEREKTDIGSGQKHDFQINTLTRNNLMTHDKLSEDGNGVSRRKERSGRKLPVPPTETRNTEPRSALKANAQMIDSKVFSHNENCESHKIVIGPKPERTSPRELPKPRTGVSRLRDRCALPVSVYQPVSIGDHVFLINEPLRNNEYVKLKTRSESKIKKDPKPGTAKLTTKPEPEVESMSTKLVIGSMERSKTYTSGFPVTASSKRPRVMVSSAELFDFSQLSEIRHSMEGRLLERSKTEFSFTARASKSTKLVPNVRRLKEWKKS